MIQASCGFRSIVNTHLTASVLWQEGGMTEHIRFPFSAMNSLCVSSPRSAALLSVLLPALRAVHAGPF